MSSKNKPTTVEELYFGYLLKSPPPSTLTKSTKAWKRYFFVLSKTSEDSYQLTYHANHERIDKPLRVIDISKIILLFVGPEKHPKWDWIQKNFKCSPSSVLFLKVEEDTGKHSRDYFLIGENSGDVNGWFSALFEVMKTQQSRNTLQDKRFRSASQPVNLISSKDNNRRSVPELMLTYPSRYTKKDYPPVIENTDKKDGKQHESPKNSSVYMSMTSVEDHNHSKQSVSFNGNCASAELDNRESVTDTSEDSLLDCFTKAFNDMKTPETSTESDEQSETHTHVEKEICSSRNDLENNVISTEEEGKPRVSQWSQMQDSRRDQILPQNVVEGMHKCLKRLSKDEAKLLVQRFPGLNLNTVYHTEDRIQILMQFLSSPAK